MHGISMTTLWAATTRHRHTENQWKLKSLLHTVLTMPRGMGRVGVKSVKTAQSEKQTRNPQPPHILTLGGQLLGSIVSCNFHVNFAIYKIMVTNDTNMAWNCDSNEEKCKYQSKILIRTWLSPHYAKQRVLKFRPPTLPAPQHPQETY